MNALKRRVENRLNELKGDAMKPLPKYRAVTPALSPTIPASRWHDPLWCTPDTPAMENDAVSTFIDMHATLERSLQEKPKDTAAPKPARALPYISQPQPSRR